MARATAATAAAPKIGDIFPDQPNGGVFGKGQAGKHASSRSSAARRFESALVASSKGTASTEQILRQVGLPKALLPGQQPPRVFMKGKGEIKSRNHQQGLAASHEDPPIDPEIDPMGAIAQMMDKPISPEEALLLGEAAPSPGEVPVPDPLALPSAVASTAYQWQARDDGWTAGLTQWSREANGHSALGGKASASAWGA